MNTKKVYLEEVWDYSRMKNDKARVLVATVYSISKAKFQTLKLSIDANRLFKQSFLNGHLTN
jgi:hypothetical protein